MKGIILNTSENNLKNYILYKSIVNDLLKNPKVQEMKLYNHHYESTCYSHCLQVSYISFLIAKKHNLDYVATARAGLLHDLFLYDWKTDKNHGHLHRIYSSKACFKKCTRNLRSFKKGEKHYFKTYVAANALPTKISRRIYCHIC